MHNGWKYIVVLMQYICCYKYVKNKLNNMNSKEFHDFHISKTFLKQHWKKDGTDEFVGYKYVEKSNQDKCVTVFIPICVNPDDYKLIGKTIQNVLNKEFGSYF